MVGVSMRIADLGKEVDLAPEKEAPAPGLQGPVPEAEAAAVDPLRRIVAERPEVKEVGADEAPTTPPGQAPRPQGSPLPFLILAGLAGFLLALALRPSPRDRDQVSWKGTPARRTDNTPSEVDQAVISEEAYGYLPELYERVYARIFA